MLSDANPRQNARELLSSNQLAASSAKCFGRGLGTEQIHIWLAAEMAKYLL